MICEILSFRHTCMHTKKPLTSARIMSMEMPSWWHDWPRKLICSTMYQKGVFSLDMKDGKALIEPNLHFAKTIFFFFFIQGTAIHVFEYVNIFPGARKNFWVFFCGRFIFIGCSLARSWALWALVWFKRISNSVPATFNCKMRGTSPLLHWCSCWQIETISGLKW